MNDKDLKSWIGHLIDNKKIVTALLDSQDPRDLENGKFYLSENFVNNDLRSLINEKTAGSLKDYKVIFEDNQIHARGLARIQQLGPIEFVYKLQVNILSFTKGAHYLTLNYVEKAVSRGNALQAIAFKSVARDGSYLKGLYEFIKVNYVKVGRKHIMVDLDKAPFAGGIPDSLAIEYKGAKNGKLEFAFGIDESQIFR